MLNKQLLIIEDDRGLQSFYQKIFDHVGYDLTIVETLNDASMAINDPDYDYIICDIELGRHNMLEFIDSCGDLKSSIVVISANEMYAKDCLDMGVRAFIRKPVLANELLQLAQNDFVVT